MWQKAVLKGPYECDSQVATDHWPYCVLRQLDLNFFKLMWTNKQADKLFVDKQATNEVK